MDKERFREFIPVDIDPGVLRRFIETPDGAILGEEFLRQNRSKYPWQVGGTYTLADLGGLSLTFVGTFRSENSVYNSIILADRRYLQQIDGELGLVSQVYIKIADPAFAREVTTALDQRIPERFPFKTATVDQRAFLTAAVEDLAEVVDFSRVVMLITLGVILFAVANTISMATRDRVQEIGTMRSLGFRRAHILGLVLGESLGLAGVGGLLGLTATTAILNRQEAWYGVQGVNMLIQVTPGVIPLALGLSLLLGLAGGILPALGASRLDIVEALRRVD